MSPGMLPACSQPDCYEPARWLGCWVIQPEPGKAGFLQRKPVCIEHAAHDAPDAPYRLEELPELADAETRKRRALAAAGRKLLLADCNRLPLDLPPAKRRGDR